MGGFSNHIPEKGESITNLLGWILFFNNYYTQRKITAVVLFFYWRCDSQLLIFSFSCVCLSLAVLSEGFCKCYNTLIAMSGAASLAFPVLSPAPHTRLTLMIIWVIVMPLSAMCYPSPIFPSQRGHPGAFQSVTNPVLDSYFESFFSGANPATLYYIHQVPIGFRWHTEFRITWEECNKAIFTKV